jgi:hypothetical protein
VTSAFILMMAFRIALQPTQGHSEKIPELKLPDVARNTGVDVIGRYRDFTTEKVQTVDITKALTAFFRPSEAQIEQITKFKDIEPIALADIKDDN